MNERGLTEYGEIVWKSDSDGRRYKPIYVGIVTYWSRRTLFCWIGCCKFWTYSFVVGRHNILSLKYKVYLVSQYDALLFHEIYCVDDKLY